MVIREKPLPSLTAAQQAVVLAGMAELFAAIGTIAYVETRGPDEIRAERRERYGALAAALGTAGIIGAVVLAMNSDEDGLVGNVG